MSTYVLGGPRARITFEVRASIDYQTKEGYDVDSVYKVEGVPFAVDRRLFEESEVFQDMFSLPTIQEEGTSLTNPVYLGGIQVCDFCAFLDALISP